MTDEKHTHDPRHEAPPEADAPAAATGEEEIDRAERLAEIKRLAREGQLDAPAGAEEIADALAEAVGESADLLGRLQHTVADFQNFQRRAARNEDEARRQGTIGVVQALVPVLDTLDIALNQDPAKVTAEQMIEGVRAIKSELLRVLGAYGVQPVDPAPNSEFDPNLHEALIRQRAEGVEPGRISQTLNVGYVLGERVIRPAKVAVAPADE